MSSVYPPEIDFCIQSMRRHERSASGTGNPVVDNEENYEKWLEQKEALQTGLNIKKF